MEEKENGADYIKHFNDKDDWLKNKYKNNQRKLTLFNSINRNNINDLVKWNDELKRSGIYIDKIMLEREWNFPTRVIFATTVFANTDEGKSIKVFRNIPNELKIKT